MQTQTQKELVDVGAAAFNARRNPTRENLETLNFALAVLRGRLISRDLSVTIREVGIFHAAFRIDDGPRAPNKFISARQVACEHAGVKMFPPCGWKVRHQSRDVPLIEIAERICDPDFAATSEVHPPPAG